MKDGTVGRLAVTRKPGERILIGDDIWIEVVEIRGSAKVKLAITAPKDILVLREEMIDGYEERKA